MSLRFGRFLRDARYALAPLLGRCIPVGSGEEAARACARKARKTMRISLGYFALPDEQPEEVAQATIAAARALLAAGIDEAELALKVPPLGFDDWLIGMIADEGVPLAFDALTPRQAAPTIALARAMGCGVALPARWRRSLGDARSLRDTACPIRLVKGEWADPAGDPADLAAAYCELAGILAGRTARVQIATHDPALAQAAAAIFAGSGTPIELGQLRGLPRRRSMAVAARQGLPVRYYHPFGPGWWPYAIEQALRRPYLPLWALRDLIGIAG